MCMNFPYYCNTIYLIIIILTIVGCVCLILSILTIIGCKCVFISILIVVGGVCSCLY